MTAEVQLGTGGAGSSAPPEPESNGSLLDQLRFAAAEQAKEHYHEMPVGGEFKKQLWIRYKPLSEAPMNRFIATRQSMKDTTKDVKIVELNFDLMAQACVCVLGADVNGENKEELKDSQGTIRLEHRLIALLGMPLPEDGSQYTAREVIMLLFGQNAMAVVDHGDNLVSWMEDPSAAVVPGESSGVSG